MSKHLVATGRGTPGASARSFARSLAYVCIRVIEGRKLNSSLNGKTDNPELQKDGEEWQEETRRVCTPFTLAQLTNIESSGLKY